MVRNLGYQRKCSGRHEDDQDSLSGRPQLFPGRRGHVDTQIFLHVIIFLIFTLHCCRASVNRQ